MITDIQYFASTYVMLQDNLTEQRKGDLIKWIKEATDKQIKSLLIRGDYKFHQESVEEFDNVLWFLNEADVEGWYEVGKEVGSHNTFASTVIAAAVIALGYKTYKRFFSQAARLCSGKSGDIKTNCMNKYKRNAMKKQISILTSNISRCSKSKNPTKCKSKIDKKIRNLKAKLGTL